MESLRTNINQICSDFRDIKDAIVLSGVEVADGTKTSEYAGKVSEVYEQGKKSQYDEFWDMYQDSGKRTQYGGAFNNSHGWVDGAYKPKYDIKPVGDWGNACANLYFQSRLTDIYVNDSIDVDFSGATGTAYQTFYGASKITHLKTIDLSGCSKWQNFFAYCFELKTIEKLIFPEDGSCVWANQSCMEHCSKLENLTIVGKIPNNAFLGHSPLTHDSAKSVINALVDYSGTTTTYTLTLRATTKEKLTETDIATITQKGWTLA